MGFCSDLANTGRRMPDYRLTVDGENVTEPLSNRLMSLTLSDNKGFESDVLTMTFDDADGQVILPSRGVKIRLAIGWKGEPLYVKGSFIINKVEHTGAPDRITVSASSADVCNTLNTRQNRSWHQTTVGAVVEKIASDNNLSAELGKGTADKPVEHLDQTNESDASFLMRLARMYGATASMKDGHLLFFLMGQGTTASGIPLSLITLNRKEGDSHRFALDDVNTYSGVQAHWLDTQEPEKESTTKADRQQKSGGNAWLEGQDGNVLVLNRTYASRSEAQRAAKVQLARLQRGTVTFSLTLAEGRADLFTEMPVKVVGFKQPIDDANWTISNLQHALSPTTGFTTVISLEVKIDDPL